MSDSPRIMLLAGEASGDRLGASLIDAIHSRWPNATLFGMGGDAMQAKGMDTLVHAKTMAVMGLWEVITNAPAIIKAWLTLKKQLKREKPLVILIDYPGFNLRFAKLAHRLDCKVMYVVSPQLWAWKANRIHTIKRVVNHMAVLLPFEQTLYDKHGVPNTLIRHPLVDDTQRSETTNESYRALDLNPNAPVVALCPGSRQREIDMLLPSMADACQILLEKHPDMQFILCLSPHLKNTDISCLSKQTKVVEGADHHALSHADVAMVTSGTMTLELALLNIPMTIIYRMHPLSFWLASKLVSTKWVGLCNIVAQKNVAPELLQNDASGAAIAKHCLDALAHPEKQTTHWENVRNTMTGSGMESLLPVMESLLVT